MDFFETVALLLRRKALDPEIVWHTFFYWIDHYYEATKEMIAVRQASDPLVWKDLTAMIRYLRGFQAKQLAANTYTPPSSAQIATFLAEEQTEARQA